MKKIILFVFLLYSNILFSQTVIKMKKEGGVSIIPCKVNGLSLSFIFDTGASDVTISFTEAQFMLKNGYLSKNDILGTSNFTDANGDISEGININLREIEIQGLKLFNVKAAIIKNMNAPLLLGQTAISKLGVVQLELNSNTLTILSNRTTNPINNNNSSTSINTCIDVDGNKYNTVKIGSQLWMTEDLIVTHFQNGDSILEAKSNEDWIKAEQNKQPSWCIDYNPVNGKQYGKLYNWYALNDPRGLAPIGWYIPSNEDWKKIATILGGEEKAGAAMKTKEGWYTNSGSNKSGFSGKPNGYRYHLGDYIAFGTHATWWSSTEHFRNPQRDAFYNYIHAADIKLVTSYSTKGTGISIRCLKD